MKEEDQQLLNYIARSFTRFETDVSCLKLECLDHYPVLASFMEDSFKSANARRALMIPELRFDGNETIGVFSDYGGEHNQSLYRTYSVLVFGWNHAFFVLDEIVKIKERHGVSRTTEMAYKDLRYGPLSRCLADYLRACDDIAGMLFTVAIHKDVESVIGGVGRKAKNHMVSVLHENGFGKRKPRVAEKLLRIVHIAAYLTAWLSRENQKIFWMSDNDEIVPNPERTEQTVQLFQSVLRLYAPHKFGITGYTTPNQMDDASRFANYLSITDLAAGAVEGYLTCQGKEDRGRQKPEATTILDWLGRPGLGLKKHILVIEPDSDGRLIGKEMIIKPERSKDAISVPVRIKRV